MKNWPTRSGGWPIARRSPWSRGRARPATMRRTPHTIGRSRRPVWPPASLTKYLLERRVRRGGKGTRKTSREKQRGLFIPGGRGTVPHRAARLVVREPDRRAGGRPPVDRARPRRVRDAARVGRDDGRRGVGRR